MRKKNVLVVCFVILAMIMTSTSLTFAKDKVVFKTLKPGKWVSAKKFTKKEKYNKRKGTYSYKYTVFKIKVPRDSILTINKKGKSNNTTGYFAVNKKTMKKLAIYGIQYNDVVAIGNEEKNRIALHKGTYYMYYYPDYYYGKNGRLKPHVKKMRYSLKKISYPGNYSPAAAANLKANKKVTVVQFADNYYSRWYKIKLKKKKSIEIDTNSWHESFTLYDSDMDEVNMNKISDHKYYTSSRQKKGTYFLEVRKYDDLDSITHFGELYSIKWK